MTIAISAAATRPTMPIEETDELLAAPVNGVNVLVATVPFLPVVPEAVGAATPDAFQGLMEPVADAVGTMVV